MSAHTNDPIRVGLVDDQLLVRTGFGLLVDSQPDMAVVFSAGDGAELFTDAPTPTTPPADVVLMDIQMPDMDGITATARLLAEDPHVRVIMLTTFDDRSFVCDALDAGASGFLLKDAEPEQLLSAIRTVHAGDAVLAPRVTRHVIAAARSTDSARPPAPSDADRRRLGSLTDRERGLLRLIALGYSNDDIATTEFISMATVKTHVRHILMKTDSRDRVHAVLFALRAGLVDRADLLTHAPGA
ncbi:response regulator [Corynebacterium uterequi]|uniref:Two component transcriptional regulator, LuxR family n=1 Tax=Corynebacterium uterequi TaxID=1072256 RepID=A0A0G3HF26_9CORY|nr:response regulator transcription factor [Corynebacterium uterequi]AKK10568.1 two component transcriptional regulator, LuxR family [Corynebacterium uterequi]